MLTQNFVNKRLKIFGEAGINAFIDEVKKCTQEKCLSHKREELEPKKRNELTTDEGRNALRYLMFLNQKTLVK